MSYFQIKVAGKPKYSKNGIPQWQFHIINNGQRIKKKVTLQKSQVAYEYRQWLIEVDKKVPQPSGKAKFFDKFKEYREDSKTEKPIPQYKKEGTNMKPLLQYFCHAA